MSLTFVHMCLYSMRPVVLTPDEVASIVYKAMRADPDIERNIREAIDKGKEDCIKDTAPFFHGVEIKEREL